MSTLNLTQHPATPEQLAAGVIDLPAEAREFLAVRLTFGALPDAREILERAADIASLAASLASAEDREDDVTGFADAAMIGGAMWLMAPLAAELSARGISPVFAFSVRETEEQAQPDGSVRKTAVFRHAGFVHAVTP